jgi:putative transposase
LLGGAARRSRAVGTRLLAHCLMPNHWHLVDWPQADDELTAFVRWLTQTHSMRWHAHYHTAGTGHSYQGRFKSFPVEADEHLYTLLRYVERNALRANLVDWGGAVAVAQLVAAEAGSPEGLFVLHPWPMDTLADCVEQGNAPQTEAELQLVRRAVARNSPFGSSAWPVQTARWPGLEATLRPHGRPRKQPDEGTPTPFDLGRDEI